MSAIQSHLLTHLRPSDTMRNGRVVSLNPLTRILFAFKELFCGGWGIRDRAAFKEFYAYSEKKIAVLTHDLQNGIRLDDALPELQQLLKTAAKISNSSWGKSLAKGKSAEYASFQNNLESLQNLAVPRLEAWISESQGLEFENRKNISRWISSSEPQRRFAAYFDMEEVSFRCEEIPAGAVMITDPEAYLTSRQINEKKSLLKTVVMKIKAFLCWFFTGMRYTHAELSLGKGETFDLDKRKGVFVFQGEGVIQKRMGRVFYGAIVIPRKEVMLEAYNRRFPEQKLESFEALWSKIEEEARNSASKIQIGFGDIFKTGIPLTRTENYDCTKAWNPGQKQYSCSATVSALYSKFGIDIGEQFSKVDQNIAPSDFLNSRFFQPLYVIP